MPDSKDIWFADTVILSNFVFADELGLLIKRYGKRLKITNEVYQELVNGITEGYTTLNKVIETIDKRKFDKVSLTLKEQKDHQNLLRNLGTGEAACIAAATERGGTVITDDRLARTVCQERGILYTGSIGILKATCTEKILNVTEVDAILSKMIENGFYSPVRSIRDIL